MRWDTFPCPGLKLRCSSAGCATATVAGDIADHQQDLSGLAGAVCRRRDSRDCHPDASGETLSFDQRISKAAARALKFCAGLASCTSARQVSSLGLRELNKEEEYEKRLQIGGDETP